LLATYWPAPIGQLRNVDDRAAASLAHRGQDGLDQRDRTEEVGGKELLGRIFVCLFDCAAVAMAGVIDQDIDGAEAILGGTRDVTHLHVFCDFERDRERGIGMRPDEILDRCRVTSRRNDGLAAATSAICPITRSTWDQPSSQSVNNHGSQPSCT